MQLVGSTFEANYAAQGGAVYARTAAHLHVASCEFRFNEAVAAPAALPEANRSDGGSLLATVSVLIMINMLMPVKWNFLRVTAGSKALRGTLGYIAF